MKMIKTLLLTVSSLLVLLLVLGATCLPFYNDIQRHMFINLFTNIAIPTTAMLIAVIIIQLLNNISVARDEAERLDRHTIRCLQLRGWHRGIHGDVDYNKCKHDGCKEARQICGCCEEKL